MVGALLFSNLPSDCEGQIMLVKFMYVANIGKTIIKAALLNILQGVLVLKGKRKTIRLTSFFVSKMTGLLNQQPRENRFSTDLYVTVLQIGRIIINAEQTFTHA